MPEMQTRKQPWNPTAYMSHSRQGSAGCANLQGTATYISMHPHGTEL